MKRRMHDCSHERTRGPTKRRPEEPALRFLRSVDRRLNKQALTLEKLVALVDELKAQVASLKALGQSNKTALGELEREVGETKDAVTALRDQVGTGAISAADAAELKTGLDEAIADMTDFQARLGAAATGLDATQSPPSQ